MERFAPHMNSVSPEAKDWCNLCKTVLQFYLRRNLVKKTKYIWLATTSTSVNLFWYFLADRLRRN